MTVATLQETCDSLNPKTTFFTIILLGYTYKDEPLQLHYLSTILYQYEFTSLSLGCVNWARIERVYTIFLQQMVKWQRVAPQCILQVEFRARPLCLESNFKVVFHLHQLRSMGDCILGQRRYLHLALCSLEFVSFMSTSRQHRG